MRNSPWEVLPDEHIEEDETRLYNPKRAGAFCNERLLSLIIWPRCYRFCAYAARR